MMRAKHGNHGPYLAALAIGSACYVSAPRAATGQVFPPEIRLGDDHFTLRPTGLLQLDFGTTFNHNRSGGPGAGWNPRRGRLGAEGTVFGAFEYTALWDFGGVPGSRSRFYQASVSFKGLEPFSFTTGVFEPNFSLQQDQSAQNLLFLERLP